MKEAPCTTKTPLGEQRRKTEAADAQLSRHERRSRLLLIVLVDAVLFALVADVLLDHPWTPESLLDFIPRWSF